MSIASSLGKMKLATKDLRAQWRTVRQTWRDDNSRRFEERYLAPLLSRLRRTEMAMSHMTSILQKARHDCE